MKTKLLASTDLFCSKGLEDGLWPTVTNFMNLPYSGVSREPKDISDRRFCEIRDVIREWFRMMERVFLINTLSVI